MALAFSIPGPFASFGLDTKWKRGVGCNNLSVWPLSFEISFGVCMGAGGDLGDCHRDD